MKIKTKSFINPTIFALVLVSFAAITLGFSSQADARHLHIQFDQLDVTQEAGRLVVDYEIKRSDWNQIQRARITPTLDVFVPRGARGHQADKYSSRLTDRRGTIVFRGANLNRHQRNVEIQLEGRRGRNKIDGIRLGRQRGDSVQVAVARPVRRPAPTRTVHHTTTTEHHVVHSRPAPKPAPRPSILGNITVNLGF